jgi:branched-subunit amino acid transport protein
VSWWPLLGLAAGAYGLKVVGLVLLGPRATDGRALRLAALLPAALLPALVVVNTLGGDRRIVVDARAAGLAVAVALVAGSRGRAPFALVVVAAAAVTALVRATG